MIRKLRICLERNKVFFETIAASLLSVMAIIVGYVQYVNMDEQTSLLAMQTEYARLNLMPSFLIATHLSKNPPDGQFYNDDTLSIDNNGAQVDQFTAGAAVYMSAKATDPTHHSTTTLSFVVNGYYSTHFVSVAGSGRLVTLVGPNNNQRFVTLDRACASIAKERDLYLELELRRFVRISYVDRLNTPHTEYFSIQPLYGATRISDSDGTSRMSGISKAVGTDQFIDIDTITADELMNRIERMTKH